MYMAAVSIYLLVILEWLRSERFLFKGRIDAFLYHLEEQSQQNHQVGQNHTHNSHIKN